MTIGVITSPKGAVIRDICTVLAHRWPLAEIRLYSAAVQGDEAPNALRDALRKAQQEGLCDVLILGRGGGSQEDLSAFNDEALVRDVASCILPIVTAVGHETDTGLVDLVSDRRAATPSQAAELVSPDKAERHQFVTALLARLAQRAGNQIALAEQRLDLLSYRLHDRAERLLSGLQDRVQRAQQRLVSPGQYIVLKAQDLRHFETLLHTRLHQHLDNAQRRLRQAAGALDMLSPLATLSRGYGIIQRRQGDQMGLVGTIDELTVDEILSIRLRDGSLEAQVLALTKEAP
ncbi:MAG: exodeoxyribonuclease VII large subunit [Litorivicinaceae bacterium]